MNIDQLNNKVSYYHYSDNFFIVGQKLYSENGLGIYGILVKESPQDNIAVIWEQIFEDVRKKEFNNSISRLSCLFAHDDEKDIDIWKDYFTKKGKKPPQYLYEVNANNSLKLDVSWLGDENKEYKYIEKCARNYWSGQKNKIILPEVLLEYPVTIVRLLSSGLGKF